MKKTLQTAGAFGLAAVTIVTGLSFGPAAALAAEPKAPDTTASSIAPMDKADGGDLPTSRFQGPFVLSTFSTSHIGMAVDSDGRLSFSTKQQTALRAAEGAGTFSFPGVGETGAITTKVGDDEKCLSLPAGGGALSLADCDGSAAQRHRWTKVNDRYASGYAILRADETGNFRVQVDSKAKLTYNAAGLPDVYPAKDLSDLVTTFNGKVDSIDRAAKTATLSGIAVPNSAIIVNGTEQFLADSKGVWSGTVSGLKLGSNPLHLTQWENGVQTGEYTLDAEIKVSPITATTAFGADLTDEAIVKGAAQPGATIIIRDTAGTEIGRTTASTNADGAWTVSIPAPNAPGDYAVTAQQLIDGDDGGTATTTIAYGAAVSIDTPVDGIAFDGGTLNMTGKGEIDASIEIREKGKDVPILAAGKVFQNGQWNLTTTKLDDGEHVLEVTQTGKGNNTTVSTVTLNPGAGEIAPVAVTNPADPKAGYVPNTGFTFEGTGTKGKTIQVENKFGTPLGTTQVENDNTWSWTRANMGTSTWTINFIQDKGETIQSTATVLNFKPRTDTPAPAPLVEVTNPADPKAGYVPNTGFTFEGTGTKGKTIQVENKFGTNLGTTQVENDNTWSWTRANMGTSIWTINFIQDKGTATEAKAQVANFAPNAEAPAPAPLVEVTNPADPKAGYVPNTGFTFEGTGTADKTIQVENKFGTTLGTTTVRPNNTWSWTRANMGTSIWTINFIQDKGTATEAKAQVANFAPNAEAPAPAPLVEVTNPADPKAGYVPNTGFTFEGTGTTGKTIQVENKFGTALGTTRVEDDRTWSWTRANMGTSIWTINFIQDKGTDDESVAQVADFAPRR